MAIARLARPGKRPYGLCVKMAAVVLLGLCFIFVWSVFSSSSSSVTIQRESFDDFTEPVSRNARGRDSGSDTEKHEQANKEDKILKGGNELEEKGRKKINGSVSVSVRKPESGRKGKKDVKKENKQRHKGTGKHVSHESTQKEKEEQEEGEEEEEEEAEEDVVDGKEEGLDRESEAEIDAEGGGIDLVESVDQDPEEKLEDGSADSNRRESKRKNKGPLFDPKARYNWKSCSTRSKHNYIPCIDMEVGSGRLHSYRHTERSCPRTPLLCLVPLPREGYGSPVPWPQSKLKVLETIKPVSVMAD